MQFPQRVGIRIIPLSHSIRPAQAIIYKAHLRRRRAEREGANSKWRSFGSRLQTLLNLETTSFSKVPNPKPQKVSKSPQIIQNFLFAPNNCKHLYEFFFVWAGNCSCREAIRSAILFRVHLTCNKIIISLRVVQQNQRFYYFLWLILFVFVQAKSRWAGKTIVDLFAEEFKGRPYDYYVRIGFIYLDVIIELGTW